MDREYSLEEIREAQVCVEGCLLQFKTKQEAMDYNASMYLIEPNLTKTVWEALENSNGEFCRNYNTRLEMMRGIRRLNSVLKSQAKKMQRELVVEMVQLGPNQDVDSQSNSVELMLQNIRLCDLESISDHPLSDGREYIMHRLLLPQYNNAHQHNDVEELMICHNLNIPDLANFPAMGDALAVQPDELEIEHEFDLANSSTSL